MFEAMKVARRWAARVSPGYSEPSAAGGVTRSAMPTADDARLRAAAPPPSPMPNQNRAFISIQRASKEYGAVRAVDNISLDIQSGELFSLLGPSGCGKTTLLRMLAGFEFPTSGEIYIDGRAMSSVAPNHRPVNMVFQNYAIFPHLNVRENIGYALRKQRLSRVQFNKKVNAMLEMIKLPGFGERRSHELSGGERQRIALARALICRPKVLLLDEPLSALDKQLREQMQLELRELQRTVGITFVFVTHDQEEALSLSDRIAVMSAGRCIQTDTPGRLYEAPLTKEVARFIGTMNTIPAKIKSLSGNEWVVDAGPIGTFSAPVGAVRLAPGQSVLAAVRPEKISLSTSKPENDICIRGKLNAATYLGDRSKFQVKVDGLDAPMAVSGPNLDSPAQGLRRNHDEVWLSWSGEHMVLLGD